MTCLDDAMVLELVEGRLAAAVIATIDEHLDTCASCRDVVALVARGRGSSPVLGRGHQLGRYVLGDLLGAGAMGRVYSAWEPELDRRVAIKVLRDEGGRERLVREAQAMAKLSHPNVVTVHEVGATDDGVYVAMELVAGETLRAWRPKHWREVARVLVDVARGLAAVHAAGVVHRDIKPDNIIVGDDGRARLGDFGLARAPAGAVEHAGDVEASAVAGTPAYMAPEVLRGGRADAASDQFGFGVVAYELLAGRRPFAGTTWAALLDATERGAPAALRGVPGWLDQTVRRCLATDPARRFAGMTEVADRIAKTRGRPLAWLAGAAAAAVLASGATWLALRGEARTCAIADVAPIVARAKLAGPVAAAVERWAHAFGDERAALCGAAPGPRSDASARCLDARAAELAALLARASDDRVLDALAALPPPAECRVADAGDPLPLEPARAAAAREVATALPGLRAAIALGDARASVEPAAALVARARTSEHAPTLADALLVQADALHRAGQLAEAADVARDAVAAAERGHADTLAARAWLARVAIAGDARVLDRADDFAALAAAAIDRAGAPAHLVAMLARLRGLVAYERGDLSDARTLLDDARARLVALGGERSVEVSMVESARGSVSRAAGDLDAAERTQRAVLALDRELRPPNHPDIARDLHNLAGVLRLRGDLDHARATYREALAIEVAGQGERSVAAGLTHNSLGLVEMARGEWPAAAAELALARDILAAAGHGDAAFAEHNLGLVDQATGDHRGALAHFSRAQDLYAATIGDAAAAPIRLALDRARSERALGDETTAHRDAAAARDAASRAGIGWIAEDARALLAEHATPPPRPRPAEPAAQPPKPAAPAPPSRPQPRRDVGVYGSSVSF